MSPSITTTSAIVYSVGAFIVGLAIAAVVLTFLARRKKKDSKEKPEESPPSPGP